MRVRMKTTMAGPDGTVSMGGIVDLPRERAYDLIERGYAEQLGDEIESATLAAPEKAIRRRARRHAPGGSEDKASAPPAPGGHMI